MERWECYEMLNMIREQNQKKLSPRMEELANFILERLEDIKYEELDYEPSEPEQLQSSSGW